jgi:protein-disulfide isomerase
MPEACGEVTLQEEQEIQCPHCKKLFNKLLEITGEACVEFELSDYHRDYP